MKSRFYCPFDVYVACLFRLDLVLNDFLQFSSRQVETVLAKNHFNSTTIIIQKKKKIKLLLLFCFFLLKFYIIKFI